MNASDLFEILEKKISEFKLDDSISSIIQIELTGNDSATWCGHISGGKAKLTTQAVDNPDIVVTAATETAIAIYEKRMKPLMAFMMGKIKVKGDMKQISVLKDLAFNSKK